MASPQRNHWKRAMEEESMTILLNNTFSALNSWDAWPLQVKPIGSKWVYKTIHNSGGSTQFKAWLVIQGYEQTDFGETYAPVGKLTTFWYLISLSARYGWNMDHLDVVTAFLNPEIDDDNIYMTLPEGWPEGLNAPKIMVRLRKALYGLKKLHAYGTTISMPIHSLLDLLNPLPILISIVTVTAFWYFCMSTISPCHIWRPLPKLRSKSMWNSLRNLR